MDNEIYEVLDSVVAGVRLQIEFQPRVNYSLIVSGIPFIRAVVVHNETGTELSGVRLTATLALAGGEEQTWNHSIPGPITANSVTRLDDPRTFDAFAPLLSGAHESTAATLDVQATAADTAAAVRLLAAIEVSAFNEWLNFPGLHAALAAFVQPNTRSITAILRSASDLLLSKTQSGSLEGYQAGPERAHQIAGAIYEALRALKVTYINPPASFEHTGQKVRTTEQVLRDRFGTCIDLAVLYAACLEAVGLFPVIFITRNHAFSGFYTSENYGEAATITQVNALTNMVEIGLVHAVELTGIGPGKDSIAFKNASKIAADYFRNSFHLIQTMIDVTRARVDGIRPMPQFGSQSDIVGEQEQINVERPFVARSSLKNLAAAAEEETVRGVLDGADDSPPRFRSWKRDLLDLSLRNPLLNMPHTQKVLDLLVPGGMLSMLDDVVHSGKSIRVSGGVDSSELQKLAGIRVASEVAPATMVTLFKTTRTIFSTLADDRHRRQVRAMKRESDTLEQETGSNYLYLTIGALVHTKSDGTEARAPLFLLPVRLTGGLAFTPYSMKLDGEEIAHPNLCLLQWLKTTKGLELTDLENPALDDSGLAINATFAGIRRQLLEAELPFRIDETASLAILRFSTFQIWKDLDENWEALLRNPVVRHLTETPGETFTDPAGTPDRTLDETSLRLPIAADGSQMSAVVRATTGHSFVLEGPPGTGKSQTITNLIAHALTEGKKVLFVAEKQAALDVVKRRLDEVGVGSFCLELHGAKQSMNTIRDQLRVALDLQVAVDQNAWDATNARLRSAIVELENYPTRVHEKNAHGYSVWSAYDATTALGTGATASIPLAWISTPTTVDVAQVTRDYSDAATRFGLRAGHHWLLSGVTDQATLTIEAAQDAASDLASARTRVAQLGNEWNAALRELASPDMLATVVDLLNAKDQGLLPQADQVAYIDRSAWRETSERLRSELSTYRAKHEQILSVATPAALEYPSLGELIARSEKLDSAWLFRALRRGKVRKRIQPFLRPDVSIDLTQLTTLLGALRSALIESHPLSDLKAELQGLVMVESWRPYTDTAEQELIRSIGASQAAARLALDSPATWSLIPASSDDDATIIRDLSTTWARWLARIGGSPRSVRQWIGDENWLDIWERSEPLWRRDLETSGLLQLQRFAESRRLLEALRDAGLDEFSDQLASVRILPSEAGEALLRGLAHASLSERTNAGNLDTFDGDSQDRAASNYLEQSVLSREHLRTAVAAQLIAQRPFDAQNLRGEVAELKRQIDRKRGGLAFREVARRYSEALTSVVPCFLMSPGSVAHFLDASSIQFDLVIFDEASQIRVPQAVGAMGRGKAVIVVGDSKQMPPTRVMQVEATQTVDLSSEELVVEDLESILTEAVESGLSQLWLSWHYRSQDESLIAFSNSTYYDDKLVSLPSPHTANDTGLSWRRIDGTFDRGRSRTNEAEAMAIVDEISARLRDPGTRDESIGVVCFNIQQRDLILNKLEDSADLLVQRALTREPGHEIFVKNLENVQGDERDIILFSLAFSLDPNTGILPLNFGPLNLSGGERRLNVAVTRARKQIILFSSFDPADIDLKRSAAQGIADLKHYLEFAASRTLHRNERQDAAVTNRGRFLDELARALQDAGYEVEKELGLSAFRVDVALRKPGDEGWRVAVMLDGPGWASRPTVSDRDGSPQLLIDLMKWSAVVRVWLPAWLRDRDGIMAQVRGAMEQTVHLAPKHVMVAATKPAQTAQPIAAFHSALDLPVFHVADDSVIASQSVLDNMRMARPAIARIAREVLTAEGPIPIARLVSTVSRRFGYSRIGEAKRSELTREIVDHFTTENGFAWPAEIDWHTWRGARRSPSSEARALSDVSPQEVANVMELLLQESFSMTRDELLKETSAVLGYGRLTEQARVWLQKGLALAQAELRVQDDGERLRPTV